MEIFKECSNILINADIYYCCKIIFNYCFKCSYGANYSEPIAYK